MSAAVNRWAAQTRKLLDALKAQKRAAERRITAAESEARECQEQMDLLTSSLKAFDSRPVVAVVAAKPAGYGTLRAAIEAYAVEHNGLAPITAISQALVDSGRYDDVEKARPSVHAELIKMPHVARVERGVYRVLSVNGVPTAEPS